ncbi:hypothetical protein BDR22DRAFT_816940 [Usnea florida]
MGQQSSQPQLISSAEASPIGHQRNSKDKRRKPKSKKQTLEMGTSLENESALALLHMREGPAHDKVSPYYEDKRGASVKLMSNGIKVRPSRDPARRSKSRKTKDNSRMEKGSQKGAHDLYGVEEHHKEAQQYPDLPSSPPPQFNRSSSTPCRPTIPSGNPLDDIPTDDDDVAAYEAYAKDTAGADPPGISDQDIFSFSQQPPNPFDQDEDDQGIHKTYQLPENGYALPHKAEKPKQKKKRKRHSDAERDCQRNSAHEQGDNMPIDPELHSMNAFPPSADLNNVNDDEPKISQKAGSQTSRHGSSQPRKRRRLEELQGINTTDLPYMSPYAFQHDQENIQDQVLPGFEDMQRQAASEFGSAFSANAADGDANLLGNGAPIKKSARRRKKSEKTKLGPQNQLDIKQMGNEVERSMKDKAENGGAFSAAEGLKLDAFRETHCEANEMTIWQFNNLIQTPMRGNPQVTALFNDVHDVLPYRSRMSVQKFCRRRFHNYTRGTWSAEEDEMLKQAVAEKGKAWKEVGDLLGRMPEDCRDRWRNYLVNSEHRNREQWTDAEVVNLCTAIIDCMHLMKEDRKRAIEEGEDVPEWGTESDQEVEDMKRINWQAVSDRMGKHGGGRSRLQCSFKWGQLKKREQADFLKAILESRDIEKKSASGKNPWRMKLASKKIANMKSGDVHAFLQAVLDTNVPEEGNIPWKSLGDDEFRATWTSTDKKAAWSQLKEKVPGFELMDYRSVANELLSQMMKDGADAVDERWDPTLHGDVSAKKTRKKRKPNKKKDQWKGDSDPTNRYLQRSNEFIDDSDAMDGNAEEMTRLGAFEPEGYNRYDALPRADDMGAGVSLDYGAGSGAAKDPDDLFTDGENANELLPTTDGEVNPDFALARRLQSAINALP